MIPFVAKVYHQFPSEHKPPPTFPLPLALANGSQDTSKYLVSFLQNNFPALQMLPVLHHILRFRCQTPDFRIIKLGHCQRREDLFEAADQMALYCIGTISVNILRATCE